MIHFTLPFAAFAATLAATPMADEARESITADWTDASFDVHAVQEQEPEEEKSMLGKGADAGKQAGESAVAAGKGIVSLPGKAMSSFSSDELPDLSAGRQELGFGGFVAFNDDTAYSLNLNYGYFFKDNWQTGFVARAFGEDDFNLGAGLFTEYNWTFENSKWVPYLGGAVKWARVSTGRGNDNSAAYGGELGMKYFIRSGVAIYSGINFEWSPDDIFGIGDELKDSAEVINFGIRFYL